MSADGKRLVSGSSDTTARVWNLDDEPPTCVVLRGHRSEIIHVRFGPAGRWVLTSSLDGTTHRWPLSVDELLRLAAEAAGRNWLPGERETFLLDVSAIDGREENRRGG